MICGKVPGLTLRTPAVSTEDGEPTETGIDPTGKNFLVEQFLLALPAARGRGIGFDLGGPFGQEPQGFFGRGGNLFLNKAEVLLGVLLDGFQASFEIFAPSLQFDVGEAGFGQGRGLGGGDLLRNGLGDNLLGQALGLAVGGAERSTNWAGRSLRFWGLAGFGLKRRSDGHRTLGEEAVWV